MPVDLRAVFLDVDGVLLDSLEPHLRICADLAPRYGLDSLKVPSPDEFRSMVAGGTRVSPMLELFVAVGYPRRIAVRAVADYEREFMARYRPAPFPGVQAMLERLKRAGLILGIVTANTRANVEPALGASMALFDPRCLYFFDSFAEPKSKAWCLAHGAGTLALSRSECVFVGDQPADAKAAIEAGWRFLGVSYGWGLNTEDGRWPMADSVEQVAAILEG